MTATRREHRSTSATLQACWPAPSSPPNRRGVLIGLDQHNQPFRFDPWELYDTRIITNPNIFVVGQIGRGKSSLVKTLLYRSVLHGRRAAVIDPKGEYGPLAYAVGGQPVILGPGCGVRLNPLDPGAGIDADNDTIRQQQIELLLAVLGAGLRRALTPIESAACGLALNACAGTPTLSKVAAKLIDPDHTAPAELRMKPAEFAAASRDVALEARRLCAGELAGLFDGETSGDLSWEAPIVVIQFNHIHDHHLPVVLTCVAAWLRNRIASQPGENYLVLDEAWRLLQHLSTARWLRAQVKLARSQRTSTIFVTQRLTDLHATGDQATEQVALAKGLIADTEIQILLGSAPQEAAALTDILGCGQATLHALHRLPPNHAIWLVGPTTTIVHHHLAPTETNLVNSDPPKAPAPQDNLAD